MDRIAAAPATKYHHRSSLGHAEPANNEVNYRHEIVVAALSGDRAAQQRCDMLYVNWRTSALAARFAKETL